MQPLAFAATPNDFVRSVAAQAPRGAWPRGFSGEQPYWTILGIDGGLEQGLIGEDGAIEIGKGGFSVEPQVRSPRGTVRLGRRRDHAVVAGRLSADTDGALAHMPTSALDVTAFAQGTQCAVATGRPLSPDQHDRHDAGLRARAAGAAAAGQSAERSSSTRSAASVRSANCRCRAIGSISTGGPGWRCRARRSSTRATDVRWPGRAGRSGRRAQRARSDRSGQRRARLPPCGLRPVNRTGWTGSRR